LPVISVTDDAGADAATFATEMPRKAATPATRRINLLNRLFIKSLLHLEIANLTIIFYLTSYPYENDTLENFNKQAFIFLFLLNGNQVNSARLKRTGRPLSHLDVIEGGCRYFDAIRRL